MSEVLVAGEAPVVILRLFLPLLTFLGWLLRFFFLLLLVVVVVNCSEVKVLAVILFSLAACFLVRKSSKVLEFILVAEELLAVTCLPNFLRVVQVLPILVFILARLILVIGVRDVNILFVGKHRWTCPALEPLHLFEDLRLSEGLHFGVGDVIFHLVLAIKHLFEIVVALCFLRCLLLALVLGEVLVHELFLHPLDVGTLSLLEVVDVNRLFVGGHFDRLVEIVPELSQLLLRLWLFVRNSVQEVGESEV
mmetsp:Transcript_13083/g.22066  ORF Transcript_13083/g.22066 Transcript_13083/m.22066 type:complete len:250 (-) Transcript_13083:1973-2722(-)